ncbi:MAG: hypothetical protein WBP12_03330 [Candidatus Saccharimonas sp.]
MAKVLSVVFLEGAILIHRRPSLNPEVLRQNDSLFDDIYRSKLVGVLSAHGTYCYQLEHRPFRLTVYTQDCYTDKIHTASQVLSTLAANMTNPTLPSNLAFGFRVVRPIDETELSSDDEWLSLPSQTSDTEHATRLRELLDQNPPPLRYSPSKATYIARSRSVWRRDALSSGGIITPVDYAQKIHNYLYPYFSPTQQRSSY